MPVSKMVRGSTLTTLLAFGLVACSEGPTAPVAISPNAASPLLSRGYGGGSVENGDIKLKSGSHTFTIRPGHDLSVKLGQHFLTIPADVTCDPASSAYGREYWDLPCRPASEPIEVTANWAVIKGRQAAISFSRDLRFVPSNNPDRWVVLSAKHANKIDPAAYYTILWHDPSTGKWVDESKTDPTLVAETDVKAQYISRRLKHFSEYAVWFGFGSYNVTSGLVDDVGGGW
jgi:hypothetical protein